MTKQSDNTPSPAIDIVSWHKKTVIIGIVCAFITYSAAYFLMPDLKTIVNEVAIIVKNPDAKILDGAPSMPYTSERLRYIGYALCFFAAIAGGALSHAFVVMRKLRTDIETGVHQRIQSIKDLVVESNAIVPDAENKVLLVQPLNKTFFDPLPEDPSAHIDSSYDVIIAGGSSINHYVLGTEYLHYLFGRVKSAKTPHKIIIVREPSQGVLAYIALCIGSGYKTYTISADAFTRVLEGRTSVTPILSGNPYMLKMTDGTMKGRYSPNLSVSLTHKPIPDQDMDGVNEAIVYMMKVGKHWARISDLNKQALTSAGLGQSTSIV